MRPGRFEYKKPTSWTVEMGLLDSALVSTLRQPEDRWSGGRWIEFGIPSHATEWVRPSGHQSLGTRNVRCLNEFPHPEELCLRFGVEYYWGNERVALRANLELTGETPSIHVSGSSPAMLYESGENAVYASQGQGLVEIGRIRHGRPEEVFH